MIFIYIHTYDLYIYYIYILYFLYTLDFRIYLVSIVKKTQCALRLYGYVCRIRGLCVS